MDDDANPNPAEPPPTAPLDDAAMGALFALAAPAFGSGSGSSRARVWEPPSVTSLRAELPQYEIARFVGRGGMGAVYQGEQTALRRKVAIKVLPTELAADEGVGFADRFQREAQAMARLSHPHIVTVYDAGETASGLLYFVMEFMEGTDLAQLLAREGRLAPDRALAILAAVCEALAFAHAEGIVHRDIKPANVMIDPRGRVKVADFGLAKALHADATQLTRSDVSLGTAEYAAPELHDPGVVPDGRADLYSAGVMLYQMLTGKIPRGRFALPSAVVPRVDKRLDAIVDKALQTDRDQRYATATEMKKDMEKMATRLASSVKAKVASVPSTARPGVKNPWVVGVAAAVIIGAGAAWYTVNRGPESAPSATLSTGAEAASVSMADWVPLPAAVEGRGIKLWDSPDKLLKARGITWEDQSLRLEQAAAWHDAQESRDAILRASVRANPGSAAVIALRTVSGNPNLVRLSLDAEKQSLALRTSNADRALGEWPLPRKYAPDEWLRLELRTMGEEFSVFVGGKLIGTARSADLNRPGKAMLYAGNGGYFRDITYYPLDGLPEAEVFKHVGIAGQGPGGWVDVTDEVRQIGLGKGALTADGSNLEATAKKGFTLAGGKDFADVAVRVSFSGSLSIKLRQSKSTASYSAYVPQPTGSGLICVRLHYTAPGEGVNEALGEWARIPSGPAGKLHELVFAVHGGRLVLGMDGRIVNSVTDTRLKSGKAEITVRPDDANGSTTLGKVEILNLDGLPEAEALNRVGISSSATLPVAQSPSTFPPGQWTKVLTKPEEWPEDWRLGDHPVSVEDGWLVRKTGTMNWAIPAGRDHGIRATFRRIGKEGRVHVRSQWASRKAQYEASLRIPGVRFFEATDGEKEARLATAQQWQHVKGGETYTLEFFAIGQRLFARANGELLSATDPQPQDGNVAVYSDGDPVRDVEIIDLNGLPEAEAMKLVGVSAPNALSDAAFAVTDRSVQTVNLLPLVDGKRDGIAGEWRMIDGELHGGGAEFARLAFPYVVPDEYDLRVAFTRHATDSKNAVTQHVTLGGHEVMWIMGGFGNNVYGFERVGGQSGDSNPTTLRADIKDGTRYDTVIQVRRDGLRVLVNGKETIHHKTDGSDLSVVDQWKFPDRSRIGVGCQNDAVFHIVELTPFPSATSNSLVPAPTTGTSPAYRFPDGPPGFVKELTGHTGEVRSMVILPDNRSVISIADKGPAGDEVNELVLSDVETSQPLWSRQLKEIKGVLGGMVLLPAVNQAVVIHRGPEFVMEFLDLDKGTTLRKVKVEKPQEGSFGTQLVAAPDGRRFMLVLFPAKSGTGDGLLFQLWDVGGEKPLGTWQAPGSCDSLHTSAWLDAGRFVTSTQDVAGQGKVVLLLETTGVGAVRRVLENDRDAGLFFTTVPDQPDQILSHWKSSDLAIYDVVNSTMLRKFGVPQVQRQLIFVDSQRVLGLSTEWGDALRLWDARSGELLWDQKDERLCDAVAVSPDGRFAVTNVYTTNMAGQNRPGNKLLVWRLPMADLTEVPR